MTEHVELVAPRQPGKIGKVFGDEGHRFIRPAVLRSIPVWLLGSRTPIPARGRALPATS
jgi:hypothetical protein